MSSYDYSKDAIAPHGGVLVGSQDDHARMVSRADRVVALT